MRKRYSKQNLNQTEKQNHFAYDQMAYIREETHASEENAVFKHIEQLEDKK